MTPLDRCRESVETHSLNFPEAAHDCRDVSETHPSRYGSTHLLWASPECPTWSQARGKRRNFTGQLALGEEFEPLPTEAEEKSRVTMWDVVRYAEYHDYEAVVVENVVDVMPWYLLPAWLRAMEILGYRHRVLFLNSMFFGVPQSRDRAYFTFWKAGNRAPDLEHRPRSWCPTCTTDVEAIQAWKRSDRTWGRYGQQYVLLCPRCAGEVRPWVTAAAAAIDWSLEGERIGDRRKPLAAATIARIQAGIDRYWRQPVLLDTMRSPKLRPATEPFVTQTSRQSLALLTHLRGAAATHLGAVRAASEDVMGTVSAGGNHHGLLEPSAALYVKNFGDVSRAGSMAHPVGRPLGSITAVDHHALIEPPLLVPLNGRRHGDGAHKVRSVRDPLLTQTGDLARSVVTSDGGRESGGPLATSSGDQGHGPFAPAAFLTTYHRTQAPHHIDEPMCTQTAHDRHALVQGPAVDVDDCFFRMLQPAEVGRGMAFDDGYRVLGNKRERVKQYGQAVTPPVARWIWQRVVESLR